MNIYKFKKNHRVSKEFGVKMQLWSGGYPYKITITFYFGYTSIALRFLYRYKEDTKRPF